MLAGRSSRSTAGATFDFGVKSSQVESSQVSSQVVYVGEVEGLAQRACREQGRDWADACLSSCKQPSVRVALSRPVVGSSSGPDLAGTSGDPQSTTLSDFCGKPLPGIRRCIGYCISFSSVRRFGRDRASYAAPSRFSHLGRCDTGRGVVACVSRRVRHRPQATGHGITCNPHMNYVL